MNSPIIPLIYQSTSRLINRVPINLEEWLAERDSSYNRERRAASKNCGGARSPRRKIAAINPLLGGIKQKFVTVCGVPRIRRGRVQNKSWKFTILHSVRLRCSRFERNLEIPHNLLFAWNF